MKRVRRIVAFTGDYKNKAGEQKSRYVTVGTLFKKDNGGLCIKLDALPVGNEWDGWAQCFEFDENEKANKAPPPRRQREPGDDDEPLDDDIPF